MKSGTLVIDCEFNGLGGQLISMALVPVNSTVEPFYTELFINQHIDDWVARHVVDKLDGDPRTLAEFQSTLETYLGQWEQVTIVADWPDDISYFCKVLLTGPGTAINTPELTFVLDRTLEAKSTLPHHALYDALALADVYTARKKGAVAEVLNELFQQCLVTLEDTGGDAWVATTKCLDNRLLSVKTEIATYDPTHPLSAKRTSINELVSTLNNLLNDCINFNGGELTDTVLEEAAVVLKKYTPPTLSTTEGNAV